MPGQCGPASDGASLHVGATAQRTSRLMVDCSCITVCDAKATALSCQRSVLIWTGHCKQFKTLQAIKSNFSYLASSKLSLLPSSGEGVSREQPRGAGGCNRLRGRRRHAALHAGPHLLLLAGRSLAQARLPRCGVYLTPSESATCTCNRHLRHTLSWKRSQWPLTWTVVGQSTAVQCRAKHRQHHEVNTASILCDSCRRRGSGLVRRVSPASGCS